MCAWPGYSCAEYSARYFRDQPLLHPDVDDAHLLIWHFEDWLKKFFFSILQILETFSLDPLTYVRTQTLAFLATFLRAQPEQEQNLLRLLVNKLVRTRTPSHIHVCAAIDAMLHRETQKSQYARACPTTFCRSSRRTLR